MTIMSCGIGQQGPAFGSAIRAGADFEIIGRAIYSTINHYEILKKVQKAINLARIEKSTFQVKIEKSPDNKNVIQVL